MSTLKMGISYDMIFRNVESYSFNYLCMNWGSFEEYDWKTIFGFISNLITGTLEVNITFILCTQLNSLIIEPNRFIGICI